MCTQFTATCCFTKDSFTADGLRCGNARCRAACCVICAATCCNIPQYAATQRSTSESLQLASTCAARTISDANEH